MRQKFDWLDALDRALWTALEAQPVTFALDAVVDGAIPARGYVIAAAVGFAGAFVRSVGKQRREWLAARKVNL